MEFIVGELVVSGILWTGNQVGAPIPFLLVWLMIWTIGGAFLVYLLSWQLFRKEIITISAQSLITKRMVLVLGSLKEYSAEHVRALRVSATNNIP